MGEHGSNKMNFFIWIVLLILTVVEVALAYVYLERTLMLILLMGFSIVKAVLIMAYFMHLKFERLSFVLTVVPATVLTIVLISVIYPDGIRVRGSLPPPSEREVTYTQPPKPAESGPIKDRDHGARVVPDSKVGWSRTYWRGPGKKKKAKDAGKEDGHDHDH